MGLKGHHKEHISALQERRVSKWFHYGYFDNTFLNFGPRTGLIEPCFFLATWLLNRPEREACSGTQEIIHPVTHSPEMGHKSSGLKCYHSFSWARTTEAEKQGHRTERKGKYRQN